ncbi:rossmann fold protein [Grosmannia clavigera kw1407]|uniref:Rossmann fold protein n=1 Tax=Grosmannia clavigera (strain kw1407 / UAMH 11150) TaxID=655863 RepID=F0XUZ7_GROCL|nr:rossmann fold protein [Grosmannia clavigera kw1407]EFW98649.1 rossmann fold protein [Grosmannia clavigera kw1407]
MSNSDAEPDGVGQQHSASPPRILIIGAGSRGQTYAEATAKSTNGVVVAVAEPDAYKRGQLGRRHIWGDGQPGEGQSFVGWQSFVAYERRRREGQNKDKRAEGEDQKDQKDQGVDAVFVCVLDEQHRAVVEALAALGGLHVMCEKPLATTLADCVAMYRALQQQGPAGGGDVQALFAIGHVLRYSPHNRLLRRLVREEKAIGSVLSVVHTEPIGWWHFTHSYVRGNWRREDTTAPSLLTKSCHDLDVLLWLLSAPLVGSHDTKAHRPATVSSSGALQMFRRSRKPAAAGTATNCLACAAEPDCLYSARRIYVDGQLRGLATGNHGWPVSIVVPDIEDIATRRGEAAARNTLLGRLADDYDRGRTPDSVVAARNWFGRCVFEADNDVCDEQVVVVTWDDEPDDDARNTKTAKTATFHMVAHTAKICERYTHLYGEHGEIYADQTAITVQDFRTGTTTVHRPQAETETEGHGGGDTGLTRAFVLAVDRVKNGGWPIDRAQREIIGCTLDEVLRSHALVFCAEAARRSRTVIDWDDWWKREVGVVVV